MTTSGDEYESSSHSSEKKAVRKVAGCLPIDLRTNRILLVSSRKNEGVWVMGQPKGGCDDEEEPIDAAQRETYEEAGVQGSRCKFLATFDETTKKGRVKANYWMYELYVDVILDKWKERKKRERRWFTYEEAHLVLAAKPQMQKVLEKSSIAPFT